MARIFRSHTLLRVVIALGAVSLTAGAWAGDRYGASNDNPSPVQYSDSAVDGDYDRSENPQHQGRVYTYSSQRFQGAEAVDPCAAQKRIIGRGCEAEGFADDGAERGYDHADAGGYDDREAIDPCAAQSRLTGRGCEREDRRGGSVQRGRAVYRDREPPVELWDDRRAYRIAPEPSDAYERFDGRFAYVESCQAVHARLGGQCPYDGREHFRSACCDRYVDERPVWVEERLPDSFFVSDGGVGPGIVDFGGGGGGFVEADNFAGSSGFASASAQASASLSLALSIHNHGMMRPHPGKGGGWGGPGGGSWGGGRPGGCGCKK
jgi:hypothetical protein